MPSPSVVSEGRCTRPRGPRAVRSALRPPATAAVRTRNTPPPREPRSTARTAAAPPPPCRARSPSRSRSAMPIPLFQCPVAASRRLRTAVPGVIGGALRRFRLSHYGAPTAGTAKLFTIDHQRPALPFAATLVTCLPAWAAAPATTNATVTRSGSSSPVARSSPTFRLLPPPPFTDELVEPACEPSRRDRRGERSNRGLDLSLGR
jgi:hypothetical protein